MDTKLQERSGGIPKWEPRSRLGIYLGNSCVHAGSVAMVLKPNTGYVSPQYHIFYDENFTTVPYMRAGDMPPNWLYLVKRNSELAALENIDTSKTWLEQYLEREPKQDDATRVAAETLTGYQQLVDPTYPPPTLYGSSLPDSSTEGAAVTNEGAVSLFELAPDILTSTACEGGMNNASSLDTSSAMMPQIFIC